MQYYSLQLWPLLSQSDTSITEHCFYFGQAASFFLKLFLHSSPVEYWTSANLLSSFPGSWGSWGKNTEVVSYLKATTTWYKLMILMLSELSSISDIDSCRMMPTSLMCWDLPHYPRLQRFQNLTSCVLSKFFVLNPLFDHTLFLLFTNSSKNYIFIN